MRPNPTRRLVLLALAALAGVTCTDAPTAPRSPDPATTPRQAQLALAPAFSREAVQAYGALRSFGLSVTNVRVVLERPGGGVVLDTVVQVSAGQTSISLELSVPVQGAQAEFDAVVQLRDGTQVLFEGTQRVTAQVGIGTGGNPPPPPTIPISYVGPGAAARSIRITPRDTSIGTGSSLGFHAQALDAAGQPVAGAVLRWSLDDASLGSVGAEDGIFRAADRRGTARIAVALPNGVTDQVQVRIVPPASALLLVSGAGQSAAVGRSLPAPMVVEVRAADGVAVAGELVTFTASSGGAVGSASVVTDASGRAATTLTLGRTPGSYTVTATVGRLTPLTVTATATPGAPARLVAQGGSGQSGAVGTPAAAPLSVLVTDEFGNPVSGATVAWTVISGSGRVAQAATTTAGDGTSAVGYTFGSRPGSESVAATVTTAAGDATATFALTARAGAPASIRITGGNGQAVAAGAALAPFQVQLLDAFGNPVSGAEVAWTVSRGSASLGAPRTFTDELGEASVAAIAGGAAGPLAVTATAGAGDVAAEFVATVRAGAPAALTLVSGSPQSGAAGSAAAAPLVVRVGDAFGNAVSGATVRWSASAGSVAPPSSTTDAEGRAQAAYTFAASAGSATVTATLDGASGAGGVQFAMTAQPGAPEAITIVSGDAQSGTPGATLQPFVVRVDDARGNAVAGATVSWSVTGGSGTLAPASVNTGADGRAASTLTLGTAAGAVQVRASFGAASVTFTATLLPGPAAAIERVAGDGQVAAQGTTLPVAPRVRVADAHGNPVAGATVTFAVATGGGSVTGGTATTDATGGAAAGSWTLGSTAGTNTLVASVGALATTFTATARASGPARLALVGDSTVMLTAGSTLPPAAPRARVTDAAGNPVPGVVLGISLTGPGLEAPVVSTVTSDSLGLAPIFPAEFGPERAGAWRATVSAPDVPGAELRATVLVSHAAAATILKVAGDAQAGTPGAAVAIAPSVQVTDGFGNAVPGVAVTFTVTSGGGAVTGAEATTDSAGIATVGSWTLGSTGTQALAATAGALATSFSATLPAGPGPLARLTLATRPRVVASLDSLLAPQPVVRATDASGAPIPGVPVTATVAGGSASFTTPDARTAVTDATGDARFSGLAFSDAGGVVRLTFASGEVTTDTVAISIVPPGLAISSLEVTPSSIQIGGASAQFTATLSNAQEGARSALALQGTIVQGAASRAAGGTLLACPSVPAGTLPVGLCAAGFAVTASNTAGGTGTLVAGPATYRLELRSEAIVYATAEVPVTLLAPEPPPVAGLDVVHGRATGHPGDHLLLAVRAVNGSTPVPGVLVHWSALEGSFEFDSASATSTTDAEGVARMTILPVEVAQLRSSGAQASVSSGASRHAVRATVASNASIFADLRALVLPEGGTKGWFGGKPGAEDDWDDPENWNDGGPPGLADKVFIPGWQGRAKPKLRGGRGVLDLAIESSDEAGLDLDGHALEVRGNLEARGHGISGSGSSLVRLTGGAKALRGTLAVPTVSVESDVSLDDGTTFGGAVAVGNGGRLRIGGVQASVAGDLSITNDGYLGMTDAGGMLHVAGNLRAAGANHAGWLTAGTLLLEGNLTEAGGAYEAFQANNGLVVRLTGGATQVVSFEHAGYSHLSHLQVQKSGGAVRFTGDQHFTGGIDIGSPTPVSQDNSTVFEVQGEVSTAEGSTLAGIPNLRLVGNGAFPTFDGAPPGRLSIAADRTLGQVVTLDAPLDVLPGGRLRLNNRSLTVNGDVTLTGDAYLQSVDAGSVLRVNGNLNAGGANHSGWLTAGTLELTGNLTESGGAYEAFQSTGTHLVRLVGGANQAVSFQHPDYSRFQDLEVAKEGNGVTFSGAQYVRGALRVTGGQLSQAGSTTFEVSGSVTASAGTDLGGIPRLTTRGGLDRFPRIEGTQPGVLAIGSDLSLDGDATWHGQVEVVSGGRLRLAGKALTVGGDLSLSGDAYLQMVDASSMLRVHGNLAAGGSNHSGWLTAGTIELSGNLTESGGAYEAFQATGTHTTTLVGAGAQSVSFQHPSYSRFQDLDVATAGTTTFAGPQYVQGRMTVRGSAGVVQAGSSTFEVSGSLATETGSDMSGVPNVTTRGALSTFPVIAGRGPAKLTIGSDLAMGADAAFGGAIDVIAGGRLRLGGKTLSVAGDFTMSGDSYLQMVDESSRLSVAGGFTAAGSNHSGWLTAGTLEIGGSFTEANGAYEAFQATGTHLTRLTGSSARSVSFAHPDYSWFNELEIVSGADATFVSNAQVKGNLGNNGVFSVAPGKSLVVGGTLTLNNASGVNAGGGSHGTVGVGSGRCNKQNGATVNGNIPNCPGG